MTTQHPLAELREHLLDHKSPAKLLFLADGYLRGLIEDGVESKRRYANRCTQEWLKARTVFLYGSDGRRQKIAMADRAELLDQFWQDVDELIAQGEVPTP